MIKKALLLVMSVVLTGCLVTVDSDSSPLPTVWSDGGGGRGGGGGGGGGGLECKSDRVMNSMFAPLLVIQ